MELWIGFILYSVSYYYYQQVDYYRDISNMKFLTYADILLVISLSSEWRVLQKLLIGLMFFVIEYEF